MKPNQVEGEFTISSMLRYPTLKFPTRPVSSSARSAAGQSKVIASPKLPTRNYRDCTPMRSFGVGCAPTFTTASVHLELPLRELVVKVLLFAV
jgi:hypothetical protein